jgi:hypothetical protein
MHRTMKKRVCFLLGIVFPLFPWSNHAHAGTKFTLVLENGDRRPVSEISTKENGIVAYRIVNVTESQQIGCKHIARIEQSHSISAKGIGIFGTAGTLLGVVVGVIFPPVGVIGGAIVVGTASEVGYLSANATKPKDITRKYCKRNEEDYVADKERPD